MGSNGLSTQTASDTGKLIERINKNQESQNFCLEDWIFTGVDLNNCSSILELCSGTGKQSAYLARLSSPKAKITLTDLSPDSCRLLAEKFADEPRVSVINQDMDKLLSSSTPGFDLVLASYGLYYSSYREDILAGKIADLLNTGGRLVVVGPYRNNNFELFGFLSTHGVQIPRSVSYCCDNFMDNMLHEMTGYSESITMDFADNVQTWITCDALLSYWKSSTFFDPENEGAVTANLQLYFAENQSFKVTKKIARFIFTKKR